MLHERQSGGPAHVQLGKIDVLEPPLHALHPASSWQFPLLRDAFPSFQPTELVTPRVLKRPRPLEEIDRFRESVSRKKRRLRHDLVTSRLSRPYATPATHIGRGAWRLGVWARQRLSGGLLLRKGAILNSIAKRKKAVLESTRGIGLHEANLAPMYANTCMVLPLANKSRPQSDSLPQASLKPLSVFTSSDYDAFDYEEDEPIDDDDEEDNAGDNQPVYSDFGMLASSNVDEEFGDASYSFETLDTSYHLGTDHGEKAIHLVMENERPDEVSVAPVTPGILPSFLSGLVAVGV
ncbi:hypothetical protein IMSHALPRED_006548 [Imshaugia aleurites]|uniref:Uncharacterized protein n=1 Tax=Imshaugia aleurites TaxID=172621 RepID=A0A8H3I5D8_9LECA|nr:hypothetical protein IMSHALPRED_006548 [Imshaugia aleurites]